MGGPDHDHRFACVNRVPMFAGLTVDDRHRLADLTTMHHYARGEQVHRPNDESGLRIVHDGRLKVHRIAESGAEQLIRILAPGDFLGESTLLTGRPVDSWAVALESSQVCSVGRTDVDRLLRERPDVAVRMLATLSTRLDAAEQQLSAVTGASVGQRLAQHLLALAAAEGGRGGSFRLPSTKRDLASYLGTTPETLSRRLRAMQGAGLVRLGPGRLVEVVDADGLRQAATSP